MDAVAAGMPLAFRVWVFAFGAIIGSFLNVVIGRVPKGESIVRPASRCPNCKSEIRWYDNIPIVSWLVLRARCRHCGQPISARYPMVEALMGLLAVAIAARFGPTAAALGAFAFTATLVALAFIDLDTWLLPHQITWPLLAVGLVSFLWNPALGFVESVAGAAAGFAVFAAIAFGGEKLLKRETMGWGDVWLLACIGAWLGLRALLPVVMLASIQGAVVGGVLLAVGRDPAKRKTEPVVEHGPSDDDWVPPPHAVPFGPFLALAALEQLFFGARLLASYEDLLRRLWS